MIKNIALCVLASLLIYACTKDNSQANNVINFDYIKCIEKFDIGSITDSTFQIIPLETNENCLISQINKIEIRNNYIYIKDDLAKSVFIYDIDGKFINKINAVGQGPGEYVSPSYMTVTDTSIIVVDNPTGKQIEYRLSSMQYIKEERIFDKIWCYYPTLIQ
jgi:hypothetical protein